MRTMEDVRHVQIIVPNASTETNAMNAKTVSLLMNKTYVHVKDASLFQITNVHLNFKKSSYDYYYFYVSFSIFMFFIHI